MAKKKRGRGRPRKPKLTTKAKAIEKDLYETYRLAYERAEKAMNKKGETMNTRKLTEREFYDTYASYYFDAKADVRQGNKKTTGNVILQMVSDQRYEMSKKQAEALMEAAYKFEHGTDAGLKMNQYTLDKVRSGKNESVNIFQEFMKEENERMKRDGVSSYERSKAIAQTLFGSP